MAHKMSKLYRKMHASVASPGNQLGPLAAVLDA